MICQVQQLRHSLAQIEGCISRLSALILRSKYMRIIRITKVNVVMDDSNYNRLDDHLRKGAVVLWV